MSMNYGIGGYGAGMNNGMMYGMQSAGNSNNSQNVFQSFKAKYGCEDCYRKEPYWSDCPIPVLQVPVDSINPSFIARLKHRIFGG